jgi:hypothetical protein
LPAVSALAEGKADLGDRVRVELVEADVVNHVVRFSIVEVVSRS